MEDRDIAHNAMSSKSHNVEITDGLHIRYVGPGETDRDAAGKGSESLPH